ncbi:hypothetical protein SAMN04489859_11041 [Paracoccus alcaliphilus]|uniref:CDI immunity protein domain-containing protein n=1 Tax=Paracoccus alcaliphilus TaxID=34002 RepID=A0A1H8PLM8_9RHOB|nr:hypothetical protein [Paracoccus alcaliphilus]SEO42862.1 hypothetical protein SAMN04489859_11041 [Paracoccus alcaliphilus]
MNHQRISLPDHLHPVETYFNWISSDDLLRALENFSSGRGFNIEDNTCSFPSDIAEDEGISEDTVDYIEFWSYSGNEEVRVGFDSFEDIIMQISHIEIEKTPENAKLIGDLVKKITSHLKRNA